MKLYSAIKSQEKEDEGLTFLKQTNKKNNNKNKKTPTITYAEQFLICLVSKPVR